MRARWCVPICALVAPALLAACTRTAPPAPAPTPAPPEADVRVLRRGLTEQERGAYLGDAACAPCHADIAASHGKSHHARTLLPFDPAIHLKYFAKSQPVKDPLMKYTYESHVEGESGLIRLSGPSETGSLPVHFVIGAGHSAHTYFSIVEPGAWMDLRISYYPTVGKWDFTPGQRPEDKIPFTPGKLQQGARLINCLLCHSTALVESRGAPNLRMTQFGIGCERCHGPGKRHVDAVNAGDMDAARRALEDLKKATPERITKLCGFCHQSSDIAKPGVAHTEKDLPRFQAAAMERSKCYLQSKSMSCMTCHTPHTDTDNDPKPDEAVCVKCHTAPSTVCPVQPKGACVSCHMPRQAIAGIPYAKYTNHWIKVWKNVPRR